MSGEDFTKDKEKKETKKIIVVKEINLHKPKKLKMEKEIINL